MDCPKPNSPLIEDKENVILPAMNGRWQVKIKRPTLMRANKPLVFLHQMLLQSEEHSEQRHPSLNPKKMAKDDKEANDSEGVQSQLGRNKLVKVKEIMDEGMEGEPKTCMKKSLI